MTRIQKAKFRQIAKFFTKNGDAATAALFTWAISGDPLALAAAQAEIVEMDRRADEALRLAVIRNSFSMICRDIRNAPEVRWEEVR